MSLLTKRISMTSVALMLSVSVASCGFIDGVFPNEVNKTDNSIEEKQEEILIDKAKENNGKKKSKDKLSNNTKLFTTEYDKSNGTWKLEDQEGNPLYEERYYEEQTWSEGSNDCHLLFNENNECCLIDRNGILRVDYAHISIFNNNAIKINGKPTNNKIYEDVDSICFAVKNNELWDVIYFNGN